jgi:hypothetical protein
MIRHCGSDACAFVYAIVYQFYLPSSDLELARMLVACGDVNFNCNTMITNSTEMHMSNVGVADKYGVFAYIISQQTYTHIDKVRLLLLFR